MRKVRNPNPGTSPNRATGAAQARHRQALATEVAPLLLLLGPPQVFAFCDMIVSIVVAAESDTDSDGSKGAGFAAVWSMLLVLVVSAYAHRVLHTWRSPYAVGFLIGTLLMLSQMFLTMFAVFVGIVNENDDDGAMESDAGAMAFFSFFLFLIYALFGGLMYYYRNALIEVPQATPAAKPAGEGAADVPPAMN